MKSRIQAPQVVAVAISLTTLVSCGQKPSTDRSELDFIQSRPNSQSYAYLEPQDTKDTFLFGGSVIKTTGFTSSALNMVLRPTAVKLVPNGKKVDVVAEGKNGPKETILSFDAKKVNKRIEVDFASAGNDLSLRGMIDQVGGMFTASSSDGLWVSSGVPKVLNVSQDQDTMVVDLDHTVKQAKVVQSVLDRILGRRRVEIVSDKAGQVVVRLFLKRQKSLPRVGHQDRTVAAGKAKNVGFFGADFVGQSDNVPVQRFNLGDATDRASKITYYLKDVPVKYQDTARKAVLSWNKAFGADIFEVEIAPAEIDVGDPRFHVIKWFDGTDDTIKWAGVAKMITDPSTGVVLSGSLYIQGDTLLKLYGDVVTYSEALTETSMRRLEGRIGNIDFSNDEGERPLAAFLTNVSRNFEDYMQQYYLETIAHEVGHTIGLRHNFKASIELENGESASVMDYAPRAERDKYTGPGRYDIAAIRWGYFGEEPASDLPFCTDEQVWDSYDCNQGDWGEPIEHTARGLIDGTMLLAQKPIAITRPELISSFKGSLEIAYKIKKLSSQIPSDKRTESIQNIDSALAYVASAKVDDTLDDADKKVVDANLKQLRELVKKTEEELRKQGHL